MNKQHKWHKEIKAWADGATIEKTWVSDNYDNPDHWVVTYSPDWDDDSKDYRIKPQPKEPQYLYAYKDYVRDDGSTTSKITISSTQLDTENYIGKIKLEVED